MHVEIEGTRCWVERAGEGQPVVLLHGLGDTHELWRGQLPLLRERYATIAVDLPGHGRSGRLPEPLSVESIAAAMWRLLDRLGVAEPVLVGLSMGGGVAQVMTLAAPERVRALVLVSTSSEFSAPTRERFLRRADVAEREGMAAVVDETVPRWFTPAFATAQPAVLEATRATVLANDSGAFVAASRANARRAWTARLGAIRCPVLFVGGLADPADATAAAECYRANLSDVEIHLLPGVSHLLPVEAPDRFNPLLLAFLARVVPPGGGPPVPSAGHRAGAPRSARSRVPPDARG